MTTKSKKKVQINKPTLIKVGQHLVDPSDVSCITRLKSKKLYIVRLKSQPNMEFPIWVQINEIDSLLTYFNIQTNDVPEED